MVDQFGVGVEKAEGGGEEGGIRRYMLGEEGVLEEERSEGFDEDVVVRPGSGSVSERRPRA